MNIFTYDSELAVLYARRWAMSRNPAYFNFERLGGDCTNFLSQCLYAGCKVMNYTPTLGWYYNGVNDRAPAWSGVNEFYKFLITNKGVGPFGEISFFNGVTLGDFIQLGNSNGFYHGLIITKKENGNIYVCAHTFDALDKPLDSYNFERIRFIHVKGYRK